MKLRLPVVLAALLVATATPVFADPVATASGPFRPIGPVMHSAAVRGAARTASSSDFPVATGDVSVNLSIQILSSIPSSVPITCAAFAAVGASFASKAVVATRTSSSAATCSVLLPYVLNADPSYASFEASFYVYYGQAGSVVGSGVAPAGEVDSTFFSEASTPGNGSITSYYGTVRL